MPHLGIWPVAGADLRRGRPPGEADPLHQPGIGAFSAVGTGCPCLPRRRRGQPIPVEGTRDVRGWCSARCPRSRRKQGNRSRGWTACRPLRTRPGTSGRNIGGRAGGTASMRSLSCEKGLIACGGDGWRRLSQPVLTGTQDRPRASPAVGGSRDGTPAFCAAEVIGCCCASLSSLREGCGAPACQRPCPG
jgi:hypothetical protein